MTPADFLKIQSLWFNFTKSITLLPLQSPLPFHCRKV
jgi:hypothetical protein